MTLQLSVDELELLVRSFEDPKVASPTDEHQTRLVMSLWYLLHYEETLATERFIRALRRRDRDRTLSAPPHSAYHETLTLFWLGIARRFLERAGRHASTVDLVNDFLVEYGSTPGLIFEYYREPTLRSHEARYFWVPPDIKPLN
ncbi:MAG: hypothetical protein AAF560_01480 [Acidobacteriota bacterium]